MKHIRITAAILPFCLLMLTACTMPDIGRMIYGPEETGESEPEQTETSAAAESRSAEEINSIAEDILGQLRDYFSDGQESSGPVKRDTIGTALRYEQTADGIEIKDYQPETEPAPDSNVLQIPEIIDGQPVVAVGESGFSHSDYAHLIALPKTVTHFRDYAFHSSSVTSFMHDAEVIEMGDYCFKDCTKLETILIPDSPFRIGEYCFDNSGAGDVTGTDCQMKADDYCFTDMPKLKYVTLTGDVSLGEYCFQNCPVLSNVLFSDGTIEIGDYSFRQSALNDLMIGKGSGGRIGDYCFMDCYRLDIVSIEEGITEIGSYAFSNCHNLTHVSLPESLESIGSHAFSDCSSGLIFIVPAGSFAEQFCKENEYSYFAAN